MMINTENVRDREVIVIKKANHAEHYSEESKGHALFELQSIASDDESLKSMPENDSSYLH
jgi:hypothetical protein